MIYLFTSVATSDDNTLFNVSKTNSSSGVCLSLNLHIPVPEGFVFGPQTQAPTGIVYRVCMIVNNIIGFPLERSTCVVSWKSARRT